MDTINTVVSRYSAPPLSAPCSNSNKVSSQDQSSQDQSHLSLSVPASSLPELKEHKLHGGAAVQPQAADQGADGGAGGPL